MKKLIAKGLTVLFLGLSLTSVANARLMSFPDVDGTTSYAASIQWAYDNGIVDGYANGNFGPDVCVRRAELLKMTMSFMQEEPSYSDSSKYFSDVNLGDWYFYYVNQAKNKGVVAGYADGSFKPNKCVNRAEAMKIVTEALLNDEFEENTVGDALYYEDWWITDMDASAWYAKYADYMFKKNLVGSNHALFEGSNDNIVGMRFFPNGDMSRKEVVEMLHRVSALPGYVGRFTE